jgi:hypothetical protein
MQLTPTQLLKRTILTELFELNSFGEDFKIKTAPQTPEEIEIAWNCMREEGYGQDTCEEWRSGGIETNLPAPYSRYCETDILAKKIDGVWTAWVYEYGGGKHFEVSPFDWIEDAFFVDCKEEEKVMTVRTFSKKE